MTLTPDGLIQCINPLIDTKWDSVLKSRPDACFFHTTDWARVLHETYGYSPKYFFSEGSEASRMAVPIMEVNSWLTGRRGITLPFTDECQVLCSDPEIFRMTFQGIISLARLRRWNYYELRSARSLAESLPLSVSFYGHQLDLHRNPLAIFSRFDSAVRRAIRKSEQEGVAVEFAEDRQAVRTFYELLCKTRSRHGLPPQPYRFFENIYRYVLQAGKGRVVLARIGKIPIAGAIFFHFAQKVLYKFGASDETYQRLRGNNLVMWKAIDDYVKKGFVVLDFGRTSLLNTGLRRFKLSWDCQERQIDYIRYSHRRNAFIRSADQSQKGWHTAIIRSLPSGLSRLLGAAAYKHLA